MSNLKDEMMTKVIEFQAGSEIVLRALAANRMPSAISALSKVEALQREMFEMLGKEMKFPKEDEYLEMKKKAYERFGYDYNKVMGNE